MGGGAPPSYNDRGNTECMRPAGERGKRVQGVQGYSLDLGVFKVKQLWKIGGNGQILLVNHWRLKGHFRALNWSTLPREQPVGAEC